jgi:hypothetical protein
MPTVFWDVFSVLWCVSNAFGDTPAPSIFIVSPEICRTQVSSERRYLSAQCHTRLETFPGVRMKVAVSSGCDEM